MGPKLFKSPLFEPFFHEIVNFFFYWKITIFNEKFNKHETLDLKLLFQWESWIKKGSKSGLLKTFGFILEFYSINGPLNSWSPHFMITLWNQKTWHAGTSCIYYFKEESSVGCGQDLFREQGFCHQTIKSFQTCETFQESRKTLRGFVSSSSVISSLLQSCKVSKISSLWNETTFIYFPQK